MGKYHVPTLCNALENNVGNLVTGDHGLLAAFIQLTSRHLQVENSAYPVPCCVLPVSNGEFAMLLITRY